MNVNDGSKNGSSNMIVEVRDGPTSGSFKTPTEAVQELDSVTLSGMYTLGNFTLKVIVDRPTNHNATYTAQNPHILDQG